MLELSGLRKDMASWKKGLTTIADLANDLSWTAYDIDEEHRAKRARGDALKSLVITMFKAHRGAAPAQIFVWKGGSEPRTLPGPLTRTILGHLSHRNV